MPPPLTAARVLLDWQFEPVPAAVIVVALALYTTGVRRVHRSGRRWPGARVALFASGQAVIAVATMSGLAAYDDVLFSVHMAQHLLLGMAAPLLLALSAPVTLLFAASGRRARSRVARLLASKPIAVVTHPAVGWVVFVASPFVLYFSPLYDLSLRNSAVHAVVHAHFILAGSLFCWPLVGVDPVPHRHGAGARMLYAVLSLPFHAFLGVAIMGSSAVLASDYYRELGRTWGSSPRADQNAGGGLLWGAGDLAGFVLVALILRQWMRQEATVERREDRRVDAAAALAKRDSDTATRPN